MLSDRTLTFPEKNKLLVKLESHLNKSPFVSTFNVKSTFLHS